MALIEKNMVFKQQKQASSISFKASHRMGFAPFYFDNFSVNSLKHTLSIYINSTPPPSFFIGQYLQSQTSKKSLKNPKKIINVS
jgi:hypothetical protein